ncbi:MAG: 3-hydroxyacyl-CoA dehydrogenase NAD-binding domain-containing protein [Candidatus Thermoplasmatota archaeon]|nr:3-hydroxyacyl-CoA dehydrogenase NAD-binding domain-containing protein [Candidatus Thermoplasmatota archaeon]
MIRSVAIIGAGNMGSGIAQKSSSEGFSVQMVDREQEWVDRGHATIQKFLDEAIERKIFRPDQAEKIMSNIKGVVGHQNVETETDLVIEAVFEDFSLKQEIFSSLDSTCEENTILATNTSSLSVNELSQQVERKDKFLGIHWFYHPAKNRLVELIPAESTSQETLDAVEQYCKTMGKVIIFCKDRPGFCVNRFFVPWINEAARLKEEGIATAAQIDAVACKAFRIGLGPFGLMDLTGPTIALHASDYLSEQLSVPRFRGADNMRDLVERGGSWDIGDDPDCDEDAAKMIKDRLMGQAFAVCSQIVEEGICSMEDVDRGAKVGLRWSIGPFELANKIGVKEASRMAMEYAELAGIEIPDWFSSRQHPFDFSYVDVSVDDGIATVLINRPESMNALNVTVMEQLGEAIESLNARNDVNTIVLEGAGKAFVAGADVKFFVDMISQDNFQRLYEFTADGHKVLNSIESSPHTTIALATGLALGGGLELALSCDYRVGTERTMLRFPETSIGIFPGLGGTQRTTRICGIEAARFAVLGGNFLDPTTARALGLLTHLVTADEVARTVSDISSEGKPQQKYPGKPADPSNPVAEFSATFYSDSNIESIISGSIPDGLESDDPNVARQIKAISRAAPLALRTASDLLDQAIATGDDLSAGLQMELDQLEPTFDSEDALEGLSALIEGRRPDYKGT